MDRREQPLEAVIQPLVVVAPADAVAGAERVADLVGGGPHRGDDLEHAGHEHVGALVGEDQGVLVGQLERGVLGIVGDVASGHLVGQPLADVALGEPGAVRELP